MILEGEGEGEGEEDSCGCFRANANDLMIKEFFDRTFGDWLVIGMTLRALTALSFPIKK